jgi:hypothetical protein
MEKGYLEGVLLIDLEFSILLRLSHDQGSVSFKSQTNMAARTACANLVVTTAVSSTMVTEGNQHHGVEIIGQETRGVAMVLPLLLTEEPWEARRCVSFLFPQLSYEGLVAAQRSFPTLTVSVLDAEIHLYLVAVAVFLYCL